MFTSESFFPPRYVTIQRGQGAERPESEEDRPQQVSAPSGQSRKRVRVVAANRARLQSRRPRTTLVKRSAAEELPSFIYPSQNLILNQRSRVDENEIPDREIAYIFPFSPAHRRDHRQIDETTTVETVSKPDADDVQETTSTSTKAVSLEEVPEINASLSRGPPYGDEGTEASTLKELTTTPTTPTTTYGSSTTTASEATTSSSSATDVTSTEEVPDDTTEFDYDDYEVSVSVAKSLSESISYATEVVKDIIEAVTSTMMPVTDEAEEDLPVTTTSTSTTTPTTVDTTTATTTADVETTTTKRTIHSFFSNRKRPVLGGKTGDTTSKPSTTARNSFFKSTTSKPAPPSTTARHSFFKSRTTTTTTTTTSDTTTPSTTAAVTEDTTTMVESTVETTEPPFLPTMNVDPEVVQNIISRRYNTVTSPPSDEGATTEEEKEEDIITTATTTTETPTTTAAPEETTTTGGRKSLKQKIQERKLKEMLAKKALQESIAAKAADRKVGGGILAANRNARPKFIPPSSLRKNKFKSTSSAKEVDNEVEPEEAKKASTTPRPATTRGLNRFRPFARKSPLLPGLKVTSPPRTTAARARTTTIRRTPATTPSTARTSRLPQQAVDLSASPSKKVTSNQISSRTRFRRPSLLTRPVTKLQPSPTTTATEATTTTTAKLTVGDIISNLNDGKSAEDKPVTLRPRSFKPKFGSKQRDKLRKKLNDHLKEENGGTADGGEQDSVDEEEPIVDAETTAVPADTATTTTGGRRKAISRTRVRPTVSATRGAGTTKELPRTSGAPSTPKIRRTQLRSRPKRPFIPSPAIAARTRPISAPRRPPLLTTRVTLSPSSTTVVKPGRTLSDADILSGLGLDTKATTEPSSPATATDADATLSPLSTHSGDSLLLQLVHGNKEKMTTVQEDEASPSTESIIMQDSIFLLHPPSEMNVETEDDESDVVPTAGGGFNPGDFLKTAVVESNVDQQALKQQARKQDQRKKFIDQENADARRRLSNNINEVGVPAATPSPALAVKRVTSRVRSRHRFSPPGGTTSTTRETTESTVSAASASSTSGRFRGRVRNRVRGPSSSQSPSSAPTTGTTTTITTQSTPTTRSRSRFTSRRRLPLGRSRVRGGAEKEKEAADSSVVQEQEQEEPKASEGIRNDTSGVRSRTRTALRRRGPASRQQDSNSLVSDELDVSRSRSRASIGKSAAAESVQAAATHDVNDTNTNQDTEEYEENLPEEDREEESKIRPKSFKPKFGARQRNGARNRLKDQLLENDFVKETTKADAFSDEAAATTPVPEVSTFRSVSPSSGISALPARFFVTTASPPLSVTPGSPGVRFASFAPRLLEHELEEIDFAATHRPLERVERSTRAAEYGISLTTEDYNKLGVSGRTFVDPQTTTTSAPTDATSTTEEIVVQRTTKAAQEAKQEEKGGDDKAAKKGGPKIVKIRKGLFGRKRPNIFKSRNSKKPVEDAKAKLLGNISKSNSILNKGRFKSKSPKADLVEEKSTTKEEKSTIKDNSPTGEPAIFVTTPTSVNEEIVKQRRFNLPRKRPNFLKSRDSKKAAEDVKAKILGNLSKSNNIFNKRRFQSPKALSNVVQVEEKSTTKEEKSTIKDNSPTDEPAIFVTTPTSVNEEILKQRQFKLPRKLGQRIELGEKSSTQDLLIATSESDIFVTTPTPSDEEDFKRRRSQLARKSGKRLQLQTKKLGKKVELEEVTATTTELVFAAESAIVVTTPTSLADNENASIASSPWNAGTERPSLPFTHSESAIFVTTPTPSDKKDYKRRQFKFPRKLGKRVQLQTKKPKKLGRQVEVEEATAATTELVFAAESAIVVTTPTSLADIENASIGNSPWNRGTARPNRPSFPFRRPRRKLSDLNGVKDHFGKGKKENRGVWRDSLLTQPNVNTIGKSEIKLKKQTKDANTSKSTKFEFSPTPAPFVPTPALKKKRKKLNLVSKIAAWEKSTETPAVKVTTEAPTVFAATFAPWQGEGLSFTPSSTALPPFLATANPQRLSFLKSRAKKHGGRKHFGRKQFASLEALRASAASGRPHPSSTASPTFPSPSTLSPNPASSSILSSSSSSSNQSDQVEVVRTPPSPIKPI